MSKSRWALVSTASDNLGENVFPHQQVLTFENEKEAIWYAANLLCEHDEGIARDGNGIYSYKKQRWTAAQLIVEWRETNLDDAGLFHIWEVIEVPSMQEALKSLSPASDMPYVEKVDTLLVNAATEIDALQNRLADALGIARSSNIVSMAIVEFVRGKLASESVANDTTKT